MKNIIALIALVLTSALAFGQSPPAVKGSIKINFNSRTQKDEAGNPQRGVTDTYKLDLVVADTSLIQGEIQHLPPIFGSVLGQEKQSAQLDYKLNLSIRNPSNLSQVMNVGRMVGTVPIDRKGVYSYSTGSLRIAVDARGKASGFESSFKGYAAGKPPKIGSILDKVQKQAITLTKKVQGKTVRIIVTDYDRMSFNDLVLASGPLKSFGEVRVNGEMLYDYERSAWYFKGVTLSSADGKKTDTLSGNARWIESQNRASTGEGEYQFDVRVNEPTHDTEDAVFSGEDDEASFFSTDSSLAALTGTAKYKDSINSDDVVTSSDVSIDLVGNKLTKEQVMALTKLLWLVSVVPINAE